MYIYIYIYKRLFFVYLFIATLLQLIRTMITLVSHSIDLFQLVLLVKTTYTIVNIIHLLTKKPEQFSKSLFCSPW